jgi:DNA-binding transcriptional ArsR family regulator
VRGQLLRGFKSHRHRQLAGPDLEVGAGVAEAFDLSQPTISHHLKVLHEAGLFAAADWRTA